MSHGKPKTEAPVETYGVMAEYANSRDLLHAAQSVRDRGFTRIEAYSPIPVHGIDQALGHPGSKVPWIVLMGAFAGGTGGLALQWWTSAIDYPIRIAGKPFLSLPAFVPVTFELAVLLSAFAAVFGMLALNGLPRPFHPVFTHSRFSGVTTDRFFLAIEKRDPLFDLEGAKKALAETGGSHIEVVEG